MKKTSRARGELKDTFDTVKKEANAILSRYKHLDIDVTTPSDKEPKIGKLYFVDNEGMLQLIGLKTQLEGEFSFKKDSKRYGFDLIAKLLNPGKPAQHYYAGVKGRHRQINDSVKVRKNIEGEYAIWKNTTRKQYAEEAMLHGYTGDKLAEHENDLTKRFIEAEAHFQRIMADFDNLEVKIVGYENEKLYPYISFTVNKKLNHKHLSIRVPSALLYESVTYRSDMNVAEFVKNATNAFGDVYYIPKGDEE